MTIHVVGGVYREHCIHPRWKDTFGSAGRAAQAIVTIGGTAVLHSYMDQAALDIMNERAAFLAGLRVSPTPFKGSVGFKYLYDMAVPDIYGIPEKQHDAIRVTEDKVVRFGMLEGDAVVHAKWAVYDPQNVRQGRPFGENGSTADHLALVLNSWEAAQLAGLRDGHPTETAPALARLQGAEVVIRGGRGISDTRIGGHSAS